LLEGRKDNEEVERKKGDHPFLFRSFFPREDLSIGISLRKKIFISLVERDIF
jgi:hypothetical protein